MRLDLIILYLLTGCLKFRQNAFLLFPTLPKKLSLFRKFLEFRLDPVGLQRHSFTFDRLLFNLQLTDTAVQFRYRLRN